MNFLWLFLAFSVAISVPLAFRWRSRRSLVDRLHREWGKIDLDRRFDSYLASEAWRELDDSSTGLGIDDHTWTDLHLDDVLAHLDHSHTGLGSQVLYRRVRTGMAWSNYPELERLADRFSTDPLLRERVGLILLRGGPSMGRGLWIITRPELIHVRWWYWMFPVLSVIMILSLAAIPFRPILFLVACAVAFLNMVIRGVTQWQVPGLLAPMRQMAPLLQTANRLSQIPDLDETHPENLGEDLKKLLPLQRIAAWVTRDPATLDEKSIAEWMNLLFLLDANALLFGAGYIRRYSFSLGRIALWIGDVDVALGVASLRAQNRPWCIPTWENGSRLEGAGIWHPLIQSPVENDIELTAGSGLVITGANASGKTTYIRAVGVAAHLAVTLNTCPARAWRGRPLRAMSMIGGGDDLLGGRSYYQVEVERVVNLLESAESDLPVLFLLDELLRGTNTVDRLAAGEAILKALVGGGVIASHCALIATHDLELTTLLEDCYTPWHFRETMTSTGPVFEYRRHRGPATSRTALTLLKAAGASDELIRAAQLRAEQLIEASRARVGAGSPGYGPPAV